MYIVEAVIDHLIFRNEVNGYTVANIHYNHERKHKEVTAVGYFPSIEEGEFLKMEGDFVYNTTYGKQFKVKNHHKVIPTDATRTRKLLAGGLFKGIGPFVANRIVNQFGDDTMKVIEGRSPKLLDVPGVGQKTADMLYDGVDIYMGKLDIITWMVDYGFSNTMIHRITKWFKDNSISRLKKDPYLLTTIHGIGFPKADAFARWTGIAESDPSRVAAAIYHTLLTAKGHTYLPQKDLKQASNELLDMEVDDELFKKAIRTLEVDQPRIITTSIGGIHVLGTYYAEKYIAKRLIELVSFRRVRDSKGKRELEEFNTDYEQKINVKLNRLQRRAVLRGVVEGASILTGEPGTGKTLTIGAIINAYTRLGKTFVLCAPTGRAAKRMTETFGSDAKTIHRLLEFKPTRGTDDKPGRMFNRDEENPLETDLVVMDEISMVDVPLMQSLLRAIPDGASLIMVGDENQLPSIGVGNILGDIIKSDKVPFTRLLELYRQATTSLIVENAHLINRGITNIKSGGRGKDFIWHPDVTSSMVIKTVAEFIPQHYGISPDDVIVLSPIRRAAGDLNVNNLNLMLQARLNPNGLDVPTTRNSLRLGDRVVHNKNDYNKEIFNGDIGTITRVEQGSTLDKGTFYVDYYGEEKSYDLKEADQIELARAISIHRAQGGEYEAVVIVLPDTYVSRMLLSRNLLYTAVTRSRKLCILLGKEYIIHKAINNSVVDKRNTMLDYWMDKEHFRLKKERKRKM